MFLMTEMFSVPETDLDSNPSQVEDKRRQEAFRNLKSRNNVQWNCRRMIRTNIQMIIPDCCICCYKAEKRDRIFIKGFQKLQKEIQVVNVLKQLRVLKGIAKENLTQAEWQDVFNKYSLKKIDYEKSDEEKQSKDRFLEKASSKKGKIRRSLASAPSSPYPLDTTNNSAGAPPRNKLLNDVEEEKQGKKSEPLRANDVPALKNSNIEEEKKANSQSMVELTDRGHESQSMPEKLMAEKSMAEKSMARKSIAELNKRS